MNIRYPLYEGVYRILTTQVRFNQNSSAFSFKRKCVFLKDSLLDSYPLFLYSSGLMPT